MNTRFIALVLVALPAVVSAAQTSCDILLKGGVFDTSIDVSSASGQQQFKQWYCSQNFTSSTDAKKLGLGATIPIDGVPIPFTFDGSQSSFQLNYQQYCNDTNISSDQQTSTSSIISKASPVIADSFLRCMALPGLQYRTMAVGADVLIVAKFNSDGPQTEARIITVDASPNLRCDPTALTRAPIRGNEVPMSCHRTDLNVASIVIGADTGNVFSTQFRDQHPPPPPEIGHQNYTFRYCSAAQCAPAAHQVGWAQSAGAPTANGWCTLQDMRPYMPQGAELIQGQAIVMVPTTVYKGAFNHLHPTLVHTLNASTIEFCGYRDGGPDDWGVDDMDMYVQFNYMKP